MSDTDEDVNPFGQYTDYVKIEMHMEISKSMFLINKKGKQLLEEIEAKKYERKRKNGTSVFDEQVSLVYTNLLYILNVKRHVPRLFFELLTFLDELVCTEVQEYDRFFVEDTSFNLTKLYFDQSCWIPDQDVQTFAMDLSPTLDLNEAMFLVCYLREYENLILLIEEYVRDSEHKRVRKNIMRTNERIRSKLKVVWDIVVSIITSNIGSS